MRRSFVRKCLSALEFPFFPSSFQSSTARETDDETKPARLLMARPGSAYASAVLAPEIERHCGEDLILHGVVAIAATNPNYAAVRDRAGKPGYVLRLFSGTPQYSVG